MPLTRTGRSDIEIASLGEILPLIFHRNATGPGTPARADVSLLHAVPGAPLRSGRESAIHRRGFSAGPACPPPSRSLAESADSRRVAPIVRRYAVAEPGPTAAMYSAVFAIIRRYFTSRTRASVPQEGPLRRARIRHRLREPPPNPHRPMVDRRRLPPENAGSGWPGASRVPGPCRSGGGVLR